MIPKRKNPIKNTQAIPIQDVVYQRYSTNYEGFEITPDIQLLGYEASLLENRQMEKDYPQLAKQVWLFARSGQGDEWFFAKETESVFFTTITKASIKPSTTFSTSILHSGPSLPSLFCTWISKPGYTKQITL